MFSKIGAGDRILHTMGRVLTVQTYTLKYLDLNKKPVERKHKKAHDEGFRYTESLFFGSQLISKKTLLSFEVNHLFQK